MARRAGPVAAALLLALTAACQSGPATRPDRSQTAARPAPRSVGAPSLPATTTSTTAAKRSPNSGGLSDTQTVGQLFMVSVYGSGAQSVVALADTGLPLLIATDQVGGRVQRITNGVTPRPAQHDLAQQDLARQSPAALTCSYYALGRQLRALGVNQDFAPVADVVTTSAGVIGDRSFGPDPLLDATDVRAAVTGLQDAGVLATLKHWPGHGSTDTDSHAGLAVIPQSAAAWRAQDRVPFARSAPIAAAIMVGHLALPALDPSGRAASLSPRLVKGQLRTRWHTPA